MAVGYSSKVRCFGLCYVYQFGYLMEIRCAWRIPHCDIVTKNQVKEKQTCISVVELGFGI